MFKFLVLALTLHVAVAGELGYQYPVPTVSYGVPSLQYSGANGNSAFSAASSVPASNSAFSIASSYPTSNGNVYSQNLGSKKFEYSQTSAISSGPKYSYIENPSSSSLNYNNAATGSNYNLLGSSNSGSNLNYNTANSASGLGSGYNAYNVGSISSGTGSSTNYNTQGTSAGSLLSSNYNIGSNYNTVPNYNTGYNVGTNYNAASNYNIGTQGGSQASVASYNTGYQSSPQVSIDTSAIDKIGSYYESASAANQFISSNQYQGAQQEYVNVVQSPPTQIFKHFYVHAAPEEPEIVKPRAPVVLPAPQKHYKIIFIKAPAQPTPAPQIITVPQQNDEKTIVYVLVKKPEDAKNVVLPKFEQKAPVKPEVFFIKYNTKQDSQSLIDNIVSDYNKGGVSASFSGVDVLGSTNKSGLEGNTESESNLANSIQSIFGSEANTQTDSSSFSGPTTATAAIDSPVSLSSISSTGSSVGSSFNSNGFGNSGFDSSSVSSALVAQPVASYSSDSSDFDTNISGSNSGVSSDFVLSGAPSSITIKPNSYSSGSQIASATTSNAGSGSSAGSNGYSSGSSNFGVGTNKFGIGSSNFGSEANKYTSNIGSGYATASTSNIGSGSSFGSGFGTKYTSALSTSQGVPHETYGAPKFKA